MDNFTITTRLERSEYVKHLYRELYKKPQYLVATIAGVALLVTVVLNYLRVINFYTETPYYQILFGILAVLFPSFIVLMCIKAYNSNKNLHSTVTYTFGQDGIVIKAVTFESNVKWSHIIRQRETKKYLLLYSGKMNASFIEKSTLTKEQIRFIQSNIK